MNAMTSRATTGPRALAVAVLVLALCWVALPAHAKGPTGATVEGPGLPAPVRVGSYQATGTAPGLDDLTRATGADVVLFGAHPGGNRLTDARPASALGPRYTVTFVMGNRTILTQQVYPFAAGGPASYSPRIRSPLSGQVAGGWFRGSAELTALLTRLGATATAPAADSPRPAAPMPSSGRAPEPDGSPVPLAAALGGALLLAALAAVAARRGATRKGRTRAASAVPKGNGLT